jgi:hypothetical protein
VDDVDQEGHLGQVDEVDQEVYIDQVCKVDKVDLTFQWIR